MRFLQDAIQEDVNKESSSSTGNKNHRVSSLADVAILIIDEAHERSLEIDLILGWLKANRSRVYPRMKLVVTSATLDTAKFADFFADADGRPPIVDIPGKTYPIEIEYRPVAARELEKRLTYHVVRSALDTHLSRSVQEGDILCFLTSQVEVEQARRQFEQLASAQGPGIKFEAFALHGSQSGDEQKRAAFHPMKSGVRRVVFATTIAETSLTIDGVVFVIDSGLTKTAVFDPRRNASVLSVQHVTQSSAIQRAGRAGRTRPGHCIRLFSESDFDSLRSEPLPEIQRSPLELTVLRIMKLNYDPSSFPWLDEPSESAVCAAVHKLKELQACDASGITAFGELALAVEQDPSAAKLLDISFREGRLREGSHLAAIMLFGCNRFFFFGDRSSRAKAITRHEEIIGSTGIDGDLVALAHVVNLYCTAGSVSAGDNRETADAVVVDEHSLTAEALAELSAEYNDVRAKQEVFEHLFTEELADASLELLKQSYAPTNSDCESRSESSVSTAGTFATDKDSAWEEDSVADSEGSAASNMSTKDYFAVCGLAGRSKPNEQRSRRFAQNNFLNNKTLKQILQTSNDMEKAYIMGRQRLGMATKKQTSLFVEDASRLKKWIATVQRENIAFRVKGSWMAQNGTVLATIDERSPFFQHSRNQNTVLYTSLFTTERGTRLCDVTPIPDQPRPEHPARCEIKGLHPRVVKELLGPRNWRLPHLEAEYDCFVDISTNREKMTIVTLPGNEAQIKCSLAEQGIQNQLGAVRERLCAAAHISSIDANTDVVIEAGCLVPRNGLLLDNTFVRVTMHNIPPSKTANDIKAFAEARVANACHVGEDIQLSFGQSSQGFERRGKSTAERESSSNGLHASIRFLCPNAAQQFLSQDKEIWEGYQLSIQRGQRPASIHAAAQMRCHCAIEIPAGPPRGFASIAFFAHTDANNAIMALRSCRINATANSKAAMPEGFRLCSTTDPFNRNRRAFNKFEAIGGASPPEQTEELRLRRCEFSVFCSNLSDVNHDEATLGTILLQARCRPKSLYVPRDASGASEQLSEFVGKVQLIAYEKARLPLGMAFTQKISRSKNSLPTLMMDEQPLEAVIDSVIKINSLSRSDRVVDTQPMHAVASISASMTIHAGIFRKLKWQINTILMKARKKNLSVNVQFPEKDSQGKDIGDYTVSLSNAACSWHHRLPEHMERRQMIQTQADDINAIHAQLTSLLYFKVPQFSNEQILFTTPGRNLMLQVDRDTEGGFIYWDATSRVVRLFGEPEAVHFLETKLQSGLEELGKKHHSLRIESHKFRPAIRERRTIEARDGVYQVFVRQAETGFAHVDLLCEPDALKGVTNYLKQKHLLFDEASAAELQATSDDSSLCGLCTCALDRGNEECISLLRCGHWFHLECLEPLVNTADPTMDSLPLRCFMCRLDGETTQSQLAVSDLLELSSPKCFETWKNMAVAKAVHDDGTLEYCPNRCNTLLRANRPGDWKSESSAWDPFVDCKSCKQRFCMRCSHKDFLDEAVSVDPTFQRTGKSPHSTARKEYVSCEHFCDVKRRMANLDIPALERIRTRLLGALDLVCPWNCGNVCHSSEKEGCDAAQCPKCQKHFCWFCWKKCASSSAAHECARGHTGNYWNDKSRLAESHKQLRLKQLQSKVQEELPDGVATAEAKETLLDLMTKDLQDVGISVLHNPLGEKVTK
jgi:HrpA-like RNA helicase